MNTTDHIRWFDALSNKDVETVGGKNASLGEMIQALKEEKVRVPDGFATTADAYREFLKSNDLDDKLKEALNDLDRTKKGSLHRIGTGIRRLIRNGRFPEGIEQSIRIAYRELCDRSGEEDLAVAVRSSATAEDLPEASFAGQQETFLNISGEGELLEACRKCFASLFTDRAIAYREEKGFDHLKVALSIGVQKMVRADKGGAGVMFSIDTETGFPRIVVINAAWGLGENVVQGSVNPDEYRVFKPLLKNTELRPIVQKTCGEKEKTMVYARGGGKTTKNTSTPKKKRSAFVLSDEEILTLARWAVAIEQHYKKPMDMEWAKDGETGELSIVQARPETVQSQKAKGTLKSYALKEDGEVLVEGLAVGQAIASGKVMVIESADEIDQFEEGSVLVTGMTDPDWVPIMKRAAAIVTDHGGRTSHAAIVSRELGLPGVIGTGNATEVLKDGQIVTVSCAEGDQGYIYAGELEYDQTEINLENLPTSPVQLMMNVASAAAAFQWWRLPAQGIGLARMEFIINNTIKVHPLALTRFADLEDAKAKRSILKLTEQFEDKREYFIQKLARSIAAIAAAQHPHEVIVRLSDFKTNEYANLIGGRQFEPEEENPMLGFRGASRYYNDRYRDGFELECKALLRARQEFGFTNIIVMIPFVRTPKEADLVLEEMAMHGLARGEKGLEIYMMAEVPANFLLVEEFAKRFDGFSIGSNDLTQLILGIDRDSEILKELFDERNEAVKRAIAMLIQRAHEVNCKVGICGQAPSDYPEFAQFLVEHKIDSISLNPDSIIQVLKVLTAEHTAET